VKIATLGLALMLAAAAAGTAHAQSTSTASVQAYPNKPIRYVVGLAAGGPTDVLARIFAAKLSEVLGQPIIVENRVGAGGSIAADIVAKANPDGYTLFNAGNTLAINSVLRKNLPYDAVRDFAPVALLMTVPNVLIVHPSVPAKSVAELVAYARANPGKINYGSSGVGASPHLSMELLKSMTGIDLVHVPYKGSAPAMVDLLGGQIRAMFDNLPGQIANIRSGKVRALGVSSAQRNVHVPDVPTIMESGVPGFEVVVWYGMWAPAGVPKAIVAKLNAAAVQVMNMPDVRQRVAELGTDPAPSTPAHLGAMLKSELEKWSKVVKDAGIPTE